MDSIELNKLVKDYVMENIDVLVSMTSSDFTKKNVETIVRENYKKFFDFYLSCKSDKEFQDEDEEDEDEDDTIKTRFYLAQKHFKEHQRNLSICFEHLCSFRRTDDYGFILDSNELKFIIDIDDKIKYFIDIEFPKIQLDYSKPIEDTIEVRDRLSTFSIENMMRIFDDVDEYLQGISKNGFCHHFECYDKPCYKNKPCFSCNQFTTSIKSSDEYDCICVICQEHTDNQKIRNIGKCGHQFHSSCFEQWVDKNKSCPICRIKLVDKFLDSTLVRKDFEYIKYEQSRSDAPVGSRISAPIKKEKKKK